MKKILFFLVAVAALIGFSSCDRGPLPYFAPNPPTLHLPAEGGTRTISFASNADWSISAAPEWVRVSTTQGRGNGTVTVTVDANTSSTPRSRSIHISFSNTMGGGTSFVDVAQEAAPPPPPTVLDAPTGVTARQSGSDIIISWNSVAGAREYQVYRSNSASGTFTILGNSSSTSFTHRNPGLRINYYRVSAIGYGIGTRSPQSSTVRIELPPGGGGGTPPPPPPPPPPPTVHRPCPVTWGNNTVSGNTMTLRWTSPTAAGCGVPTTILFRAGHPNSTEWSTIQTLPGTATTVTFNFSSFIDRDGFVRVGIVTENSAGSDGGRLAIWDNVSRRWI